jgi:hypothetical protein
MDRFLRPGARSKAGDNAFRRAMWSTWGPSPLCYHCGERISPGLGTIQHLLSPNTYPHLRFDPFNVRPAHAGGKRRSPVGDLDCQAIAASNTAPRDAQGRPLPFSEAFKQQKIEERKAAVAAGPRRNPPPSGSPAARKPAAAPRREYGRPW